MEWNLKETNYKKLFKICKIVYINKMNNNRSTYRNLINFGSNSYVPTNDPLTYAINDEMDQRFVHGMSSPDTIGQHGKASQAYLSDYCAEKWDNFCELASYNTNRSYPNNLQPCEAPSAVALGLNAGEILIYNTASKKYLKKMLNCKKKYESFDPNVPNSPMISYWVSNNCNYTSSCIPVYAVDPKTIDNDIVMDKILEKPAIAMDILINIYNTMKREGTFSQLKGTKIGNFYNTNKYFKAKIGN
jgi:hypothetical protein|uniref:Uncharacterized protein n=1 Tax=viral metagenome TaxID=1070528 RepID=A0A6C0CZS9_9ZZZZ